MSTIDILIEQFEFNRTRTLGTLDAIEKDANPRAALAFRPGPGRAHIGWQLMHIGITEELFATERLVTGKTGAYQSLHARFRGGSTPDDDVPAPEMIRRILTETREELLATVRGFDDSHLGLVPEGLKERGWTMRTGLLIAGWHEPHHQGQAHITYNLYKQMQNAK